MPLHSRNKAWDLASVLHMAHVSELCLAKLPLSGGREKGGLPSFYQCFSGALIQPHLQFFCVRESEATNDLSQEGFGKWDLWEMGKVEKHWHWWNRLGSVNVRELVEVNLPTLVSPQCEPDIPSNAHLVHPLYTLIHICTCTHQVTRSFLTWFTEALAEKGTSTRVCKGYNEAPSSACCAYHFGRRPPFHWLVPNCWVQAVNCE